MQEIRLEEIQRNAAEFITGLYESPDLPHYPYHNIIHTRGVVFHAREMAGHYRLDLIDTCIVTVASWFHDVGQLYGPMQEHEERGVAIMEDHMRQSPPALVTAIGRCILATKFDSRPSDLLEQIVRDADTYHLGTDLFRETDPLVRKEVEMRTGKIFTDREWGQKTLALLRQHTFFTTYSKDLLNGKKQENIEWLESKIRS
jgi:predicted metal-dependent HD superfamily phosphohydrolase